jgi:hypothetical protein
MSKLVREKKKLVPIVGDGAIGHPDWADGRLIPVLILDCKDHKALEDLMLAHKDTSPGDVTTVWGWKLLSKKQVFLSFNFHRPVETSVTIAFDVAKQGSIVDWIINVRGVYLQPLSSGKKVSEGLENPKILVEVPPEATFPSWKDIYRRHLEKSYIKRGLSRSQAKTATNQHLESVRNIQFRKPPLISTP